MQVDRPNTSRYIYYTHICHTLHPLFPKWCGDFLFLSKIDHTEFRAMDVSTTTNAADAPTATTTAATMKPPPP